MSFEAISRRAGTSEATARRS
ncbi:hypothetical protein [Arthrobacter sp.]